ncbi:MULTISPECIES: AMP-binding protein [unclassified Vibrio]|uniref:AMP-binding protein n=1 Tax=Vibrio sp. HB236076 TaxID=3232307 RepID=A0AB39H8M5_9VIBR|nr:AMP-binding protein [Vibrio sp. HB161653]MDP5253818.1 AMP-binding protein [Vibrio sp. HB161653]
MDQYGCLASALIQENAPNRYHPKSEAQACKRVYLTYPAMEVDGIYYSGEEVGKKVQNYQRQLNVQGVRANQVVMVVCRHQPQVVWFYLAMLSIGAVTAFVAPQTHAQLADKAEQLFASGAVRWFWSPDGDMALPKCPLLRLKDELPCQIQDHDTSSQADHGTRGGHFNLNVIASLVFTSGSTGQPKAVAHSLAQHLECAQAVNQALRFDSTSRWLVSLPFYHVSGLALIHRCFLANATLVFGRDWQQYLPCCSHVSMVATQLLTLLSSPRLLESLPCVLLGGSSIPESLLPLLRERGLQDCVWLGYGMTESASTVTLGRLASEGTSGQPLWRREVRLNEQIIEIKSPSLAMGYYYQGQLTPLSDPGSWWQSSDLGCWQNQQLKVLGRRDNAFMSGGENIHCEEIERTLLNHPDIDRVMVFAVADERYGARPVAVYSGRVNLAQLTPWLQQHLEKFKCPEHYALMPSWAVSSPVKIPRYRLKNWLKVNRPDWTLL